MKYTVLFILLILTFPSYAKEDTGETCRSYVIDHSINKKYCLRDLDEKIEEVNRKLQQERNPQESSSYQQGGNVVPRPSWYPADR